MIRVMFISLLSLGWCCGQLHATPKKEVLEKYKSVLSQEIPFKFEKKSLWVLLEHLKKKSEFTIILDEKSILRETPKVISKKLKSSKMKRRRGHRKNELVAAKHQVDSGLYRFPVLTFNYKKIPLIDALNWLVELTYIDFEISEKGIRITTKEALIKPLVKLKRYDFRAMFFKPSNFWLPSVILNIDGDDSGGAIEFSDDEESDSEGVSAQTVDDLIVIIEENIKDGDWGLRATDISSQGNVLSVQNTPSVHARVKDIIDRLQNVSKKQVAISFKFFKTPVDALDQFYEANPRGAFLTFSAYKKLILKEIATVKDVVELSASQMVCFNGQSVFSFSARSKSDIYDYNISDSTASAEVDFKASKGFGFEVRPVVSFDNSEISLNFKVEQILSTKITHQKMIIQKEQVSRIGIKLKGSLDGSGEAEQKDNKSSMEINGNVNSTGSLLVHPGSPVKYGVIAKMQREICQYYQSLKLENGGAVILKRTLQNENTQESYYLILQAQIIHSKMEEK